MRLIALFFVGMLCVLWAMAVPASKKYWQNVGPSWDRTLNPGKYDTEGNNG